MSSGKIIVENAGKQVVECMLNGEIYIKCNYDSLAGIHTTGGYLQIEGNVTQWHGGKWKKVMLLLMEM